MAANSVLILFAHPAFQRSRVNRALIAAAGAVEGVTVHDLYQLYPDSMIDIGREQAALRAHDIVVFHHPLMWYSAPALLKEWQDLVLQHGFAYGRGGTVLLGKALMSAITTGGRADAYRTGGSHRFPIDDYLHPFEQLARYCGMTWLAPFVVHGTHGLDQPAIDRYAEDYRRHLLALRESALGASPASAAV